MNILRAFLFVVGVGCMCAAFMVGHTHPNIGLLLIAVGFGTVIAVTSFIS